MKKAVCAMLVVLLCLVFNCSVCAADGNVTYSGNAGEFVFGPGSEQSLTDLFSNFKDVMPGDTLTQPITVKNDADNKVKVKIYIRSLGAQAESAEFLSQLRLQVAKSEQNTMAYMFDADADQTAEFTDWVCLGTLYSGGEVNLDVVLTVPVELGNEFKQAVGFLDWEFMIEEFPIEPSDPQIPSTGEKTTGGVIAVLLAVVGFMCFWLFYVRKARRDTAD